MQQSLPCTLSKICSQLSKSDTSTRQLPCHVKPAVILQSCNLAWSTQTALWWDVWIHGKCDVFCRNYQLERWLSRFLNSFLHISDVSFTHQRNLICSYPFKDFFLSWHYQVLPLWPGSELQSGVWRLCPFVRDWKARRCQYLCVSVEPLCLVNKQEIPCLERCSFLAIQGLPCRAYGGQVIHLLLAISCFKHILQHGHWDIRSYPAGFKNVWYRVSQQPAREKYSCQ